MSPKDREQRVPSAPRRSYAKLPAVLEVISLLSVAQEESTSASGEALAALRAEVLDAGIRFLGIEDDHILLEQHGHAHKPVRSRQLAEMLLEIRRLWLR